MFKKLLVPALLFASVAAPALAEPAVQDLHFSRDGQEYIATMKTEGSVTTIRGYEKTSGEPFRLRIADGRAKGYYGSRAVSFDVAPVTAPTQTASR